MAPITLTTLRRLPARALIGALRAYRMLLSPWLGNQCRFEPTCSLFAITALERHGAAGGSYLALRRVLRCHPWCSGGLDPVPDQPPRFPWHRSAGTGTALSPHSTTLRVSPNPSSSKPAP
jgi:putative membrane protein insertion efficiency factor